MRIAGPFIPTEPAQGKSDDGYDGSCTNQKRHELRLTSLTMPEVDVCIQIVKVDLISGSGKRCPNKSWTNVGPADEPSALSRVLVRTLSCLFGEKSPIANPPIDPPPLSHNR